MANVVKYPISLKVDPEDPNTAVYAEIQQDLAYEYSEYCTKLGTEKAMSKSEWGVDFITNVILVAWSKPLSATRVERAEKAKQVSNLAKMEELGVDRETVEAFLNKLRGDGDTAGDEINA